MTRADQALGEQRYTGGDIEREERMPPARMVGKLTVLRVSGYPATARLGQRIEFRSWPHVGSAFFSRTAGSPPGTPLWGAGVVTSTHACANGVFFTARGWHYMLERDA
jgi:hypothetical protein